MAREPLRLRSVPRDAQRARTRAAELKEKLAEAKALWKKSRFGDRVKLQALIGKKLPRGSVGESLRRKAGIAEACSSCDERVAAYRPHVRNRALRRFSGPELKRRVEEVLASRGKPFPKPKAKDLLTEDEEEDESGDDGVGTDTGSDPDWDPPTSPHGGSAPAAIAAA